MSLLVITLFTFIAALSLVLIMFMLPMAVQNTPQARIRRRLTSIGRLTFASKAEIQSILKSSIYSEVDWLNNLLARFRLTRHISLLLERGNVDMTPGLFLLLCGGAGAITMFLFINLGQPLLIAMLLGAMALVSPYIYLKVITWRRLRKFLEQMPDGLDMIAQSLQAGLGLTQSLVFVGKEMPDPLGTEFSVFIEEVNLGLPLNEAMANFQERMNLPEVRLFSTALLVQREVGGSLAELLNKLSDIIRDRFRIERMIKSLTAQNRMSAWVVCAIPPILALFMFIKEPEIMNTMMTDPTGRGMLAVGLVLEILGILTFRKLIKIHI
jgi:tight adherence protein B